MEPLKPLPRLDDDAAILGFTPDTSAGWVVTYAGPCPDEGCTEPHKRLYAIPIVGWLHYEDLKRGIALRPAIMGASGGIVDYLDVPDEFMFIGVLADTEEMPRTAHALYHAKMKGGQAPDIDLEAAIASTMN